MSDFLQDLDNFTQREEQATEDLGHRLKVRRTEFKLTQEELAVQAHVDVKSVIIAVERGHRRMGQLKGDQLLGLADALGCTVDYLLGHTVEGGIPGA